MLIPIKYNIRYLMNRWSGTLMTAFTFALVVATFIIVMSLERGIERALMTTGDPLNVIVLRPGAQAEGQSVVTKAQYQIVRNFPGIAKDEKGEALIVPELIVLANKPKQPDGKSSNLMIRGVHLASLKMRPAVTLVAGRMFKPGVREAVVSRAAAKRFQNLNLGDAPQLGRGKWTIVGVFEAKGSAYDSELWADYQELMQEFDRDAYSTLFLRAIDAAAVVSIIKQVEDDVRLKLTAKSESAYYKEQTQTGGPLIAFGVFLAVIMSIGACFAGMNTMYASVANRVREIATLRVLGFSPISILFCFQIESIALALFGGALGCLLALPMNGWATGTTNFDTFSEVIFYFTITPELMGKGLIFAAIMGAIGGFLPAFSAARQPIIQGLRKA